MELYCCTCPQTAVSRLQSTRKTVRNLLNEYQWHTNSVCFLSVGYDLGGVMTSSKREGEHKKQKETHCLYPGDLYPFTRRPLFVIVDSDNSFVFQHIPRYFGQPLVTLMSPQDTPPAFHGMLCCCIMLWPMILNVIMPLSSELTQTLWPIFELVIIEHAYISARHY